MKLVLLILLEMKLVLLILLLLEMKLELLMILLLLQMKMVLLILLEMKLVLLILLLLLKAKNGGGGGGALPRVRWQEGVGEELVHNGGRRGLVQLELELVELVRDLLLEMRRTEGDLVRGEHGGLLWLWWWGCLLQLLGLGRSLLGHGRREHALNLVDLVLDYLDLLLHRGQLRVSRVGLDDILHILERCNTQLLLLHLGWRLRLLRRLLGRLLKKLRLLERGGDNLLLRDREVLSREGAPSVRNRHVLGGLDIVRDTGGAGAARGDKVLEGGGGEGRGRGEHGGR